MGKLTDFAATRGSVKSKNSLISSKKDKPKVVKAKTKARSYMSEPESLESAPATASDIQTIQLEFEKRLQALQAENKLLKSIGEKLSKNEEKLLSAIKSEKIEQGIEKPIIGRSRLIKFYKINTKYLDTAISGLELKGLIKRIPIKYSQNIMTNSWEIL